MELHIKPMACFFEKFQNQGLGIILFNRDNIIPCKKAITKFLIRFVCLFENPEGLACAEIKLYYKYTLT